MRHHGAALAEDVKQAGLQEGLRAEYEPFLELNDSFKVLCGDWQLRDGNPNDHSDAAYDAEVIGRLQRHRRAQPSRSCAPWAAPSTASPRYGPRLAETLGQGRPAATTSCSPA